MFFFYLKSLQPVSSTEQIQKSGISMSVKTQNQCITVMDAYKNKSIEVVINIVIMYILFSSLNYNYNYL